MPIVFHPLPAAAVAKFRLNGRDAYGNTPIQVVSSGQGAPCRNCLRTVPKGKGMLILAWRPFDDRTPYAETGPIFLCADACTTADPCADLPAMLQGRQYVLRPYTAFPQIRYGLEALIATPDVPRIAEQMLQDPDTAFVDLRHPMTGCFQCRITRH